MTREQVKVEIILYSNSKARIVFRKSHRWLFNKIQEQMGEEYWHPDSFGSTYPNWIIIAVHSTNEIYEASEPNDLLRIVKKPSIDFNRKKRP